VKDDAVIRVQRESYNRAKALARRSGRDLREIAAAALEAYVARELDKRPA
jgi:predicted transcriptional regulator